MGGLPGRPGSLLEWIDRKLDWGALSAIACTEDERAQIGRAEEGALAPFDCWVAKEAILKASRTGVTGRARAAVAANAGNNTGRHHANPLEVAYAAIVADPAQHGEPQAPPVRPRAPDLPTFKLGDTVAFTDKHLRERVGTIVRMNTRMYSLLCDGEQWRVSPALLRKIIDL
jgi:hypothetical protein